MLVFNKCLALMFSLMILGQAYLVRRAVGTWVFPACLFGLIWFAYTFFPLAVLYWIPIQPYGVAFIFVCTVAFSLGCLPFNWQAAFRSNGAKLRTTREVYGSPFLRLAFYSATLLSLVFLALNSRAQGISLHDLVFDLYGSAASYAAMRYAGTLNSNIFGPLALLCSYVGVVIGGLVYACRETRGGRARILAFSFLPSMLVAVTQSAKGLLFLSVVFFYAAVLACRLSEGKPKLIEKRNFKWVAICVVILVAIVTVSFLAGGISKIKDSDARTYTLLSYFASYSFGHTYAFSDWLSFTLGRHSEDRYIREGLTYGFYTFQPVFRVLGSAKIVPIGIFDDYYSYRNGFLFTNIYTMFRGMVLDFGIAGSVFVMFLAGILFHLSFHSMLVNRRPVFSVAVFVIMLGFFYGSFGISLFIWNSTYVTFAAIWMVLEVNKFMTARAYLGSSAYGGSTPRAAHS